MIAVIFEVFPYRRTVVLSMTCRSDVRATS
jgi:hypothetical protein